MTNSVLVQFVDGDQELIMLHDIASVAFESDTDVTAINLLDGSHFVVAGNHMEQLGLMLKSEVLVEKSSTKKGKK